MLTVKVRRRCASADGCPVIICGNTGCIVRFDLDREWDSARDPTACIAYSADGLPVTAEIPIRERFAVLPAIRRASFIEIGVSADGIRTTTPARIPCLPGIADFSGSPDPVPRDIFNELIARIIRPEPEPALRMIADADGLFLCDSSGLLLMGKE